MGITPGSRVGPYDVVSAIAAGGMGEVFLARDTRLRRQVVLKTLLGAESQSAEARKRLLHEARAAATLNHPNIASIYDILELDDQTVIVMEYVPGESLVAKVRKGGLPQAEVVDLGLQLADALIEAHRHGIVHRDLKPANVCLTPDGRLKVLDFGIARIRPVDRVGLTPGTTPDTTPGATVGETISVPGRIVGTPGYTAPEQLRGESADHRSDIYSLGVLLFELCTGRLPFDAPDALGLALATASDTPLRAHEVQPAVSQQMSDVITRAMTRERHDRYQSVESMRTDLRRLDVPRSERTTTAAEIHVPPSTSTPILSKTLATLQQLTGGHLARAVAVVAVIVVGAWFIANQGGPTPSLTTTVTIAPTVAVLPFVNERDDPANDYDHLGAGLADLIVSALDGLPAVSVVSGVGTLGADATDADLATIASGLGATAIVQGSFSLDGDEFEVSASLHAADGSEVWDDGYSDSFMNFFTMERELVEDLVQAIGIDLTEAERARLARVPTESTEAFEAYAQGRVRLDRRDPTLEDVPVAVRLFTEAIEVDPEFALAHAGLGDAYWWQFREDREAEAATRAADAVLAALALDPDLPQVRLSLATIYRGTGRVEQAEDQVRQVIEGYPSNSDAHRVLGQILDSQRRTDEAVAEYGQAIALRPSYWRNYFELGLTYYQANRRPLAAAQFRRVTELMPESARGFQVLGSMYQTMGELELARENYERSLEFGALPAAHSNIGLLEWAAGNYEAAAEAFAAAVALAPDDFRYRRNLGDAYRVLGREEEALAEYRRAVEKAADVVRVNAADVVTLGQLATIESLAGSHEAALGHIDDALQLAPGDPGLLYTKAVVHAASGDTETALSFVISAVSGGYPPTLARQQGELTALEGMPEFEELLVAAPAPAADAPGQQMQQLRGLLETLVTEVSQGRRAAGEDARHSFVTLGLRAFACGSPSQP